MEAFIRSRFHSLFQKGWILGSNMILSVGSKLTSWVYLLFLTVCEGKHIHPPSLKSKCLKDGESVKLLILT